MAKFTVKDLKKVLEKLDDSKEFMISNSYAGNAEIEVEYIKELKENGRQYYKIIM